MNTKTTTGLSALIIVIAASGWMLAQTPPNPSLTPPGSPANGVFKTLDQVEPRIAVNSVNTPGSVDRCYQISAPGSYYLTGDVTGQSSQYGIFINSDNVTLDLNGFSVVGVPGSIDGIFVASTSGSLFRNIRISNGSLRNWGGHGFHDSGECRVKIYDVTSHSNAGAGFRSHATSEGYLTRCDASGNGGDGVEGNGLRLDNCAVADNSGYGIDAQLDSTIRHCVISGNTLGGISEGGNALIEGNQLTSNGGDGIRPGSSSVVRSNVINKSIGVGIRVLSGRSGIKIEGNYVSANDGGIFASGVGNRIVQNCLNRNYGSGNLSIISGNQVGDILASGSNTTTLSTSGASLQVGNTPVTSPWANFIR